MAYFKIRHTKQHRMSGEIRAGAPASLSADTPEEAIAKAEAALNAYYDESEWDLYEITEAKAVPESE
jgi:hypothetical protein